MSEVVREQEKTQWSVKLVLDDERELTFRGYLNCLVRAQGWGFTAG
jgi:hypothetical protein